MNTVPEYYITAQAAIRAAFLESFPEFAAEFRKSKRQNAYRTDIRVAFVDFVDQSRRNGFISEKLAKRVTL